MTCFSTNHSSTALALMHLEDAVSSSLLQFVCMIEHGTDIKLQLLHEAPKSDLAMSHLLQYNCFAKYKEGSTVHRHSKDHETPFVVFTGMHMLAKTRKRQLVEMLHENGLSISYTRVLEISAQLGEAVVAQYVEDGEVCPLVLKKNLFTTSAVETLTIIQLLLLQRHCSMGPAFPSSSIQVQNSLVRNVSQ